MDRVNNAPHTGYKDRKLKFLRHFFKILKANSAFKICFKLLLSTIYFVKAYLKALWSNYIYFTLQSMSTAEQNFFLLSLLTFWQGSTNAWQPLKYMFKLICHCPVSKYFWPHIFNSFFASWTDCRIEVMSLNNYGQQVNCLLYPHW